MEDFIKEAVSTLFVVLVMSCLFSCGKEDQQDCLTCTYVITNTHSDGHVVSSSTGTYSQEETDNCSMNNSDYETQVREEIQTISIDYYNSLNPRQEIDANFNVIEWDEIYSYTLTCN